MESKKQPSMFSGGIVWRAINDEGESENDNRIHDNKKEEKQSEEVFPSSGVMVDYLREKGLSTTGIKAELIQRVGEYNSLPSVLSKFVHFEVFPEKWIKNQLALRGIDIVKKGNATHGSARSQNIKKLLKFKINKDGSVPEEEIKQKEDQPQAPDTIINSNDKDRVENKQEKSSGIDSKDPNPIKVPPINKRISIVCGFEIPSQLLDDENKKVGDEEQQQEASVQPHKYQKTGTSIRLPTVFVDLDDNKSALTVPSVSKPLQSHPVNHTKEEANEEALVRMDYVVKNGTLMRGVLAKVPIKPKTLIAKYPGVVTKKRTRDFQTRGFDVDYKRHVTQYDMVFPSDEEKLIVPTDTHGYILPIYLNKAALFLNEPSKGEKPNVCFREDGDDVNVISIRNILAGDELLIYYGNKYQRNYEIFHVTD